MGQQYPVEEIDAGGSVSSSHCHCGPQLAQFATEQDSGAEQQVLKRLINVKESNIFIPLPDLLRSSQDTVRDRQEGPLQPIWK